MVTPWLWFVVLQVTCRCKWWGVPWLLGVWLKSEMQIGPGPDRNFLETGKADALLHFLKYRFPLYADARISSSDTSF